MRKPKFHVTSIAVAVAACLATPLAQAQTTRWILNADGDWFDANWSNGVPKSTSDVVIDALGNRTITYAVDYDLIRSLTITNNTLLVDSGELQVSGAYANIGSGRTLIGDGGLVLNGPSMMDTLVIQGRYGQGYLYGSGAISIRDLQMNLGYLGSYQSQNSGAITVTGHADFNGAAFLAARNQVVNINGTATWSSGNGQLTIGGTSTLNIGAGAVFSDLGALGATGSKSIGTTEYGRAGTVSNQGSYVRTGTGITSMSTLQNTGLLDVQEGSLQITSQLNNQGQTQVHAGAMLSFAGTNGIYSRYTINAGSQVNNEGVISLSRGQLDIQQGALLNGKGEWRFEGKDYYGSDQMRFFGTQSISKLTINSTGTLDILGSLTTQSFDFQRGSVGQYPSGPGTLIVTGDAALLNSVYAKTIAAGYQLVLNGRTRWAAGDNNILDLQGGGSNAERLVIGSGGSFLDEGGGGAYRRLGTTNSRTVITNNGVFERQGGGISAIASTFNNRGELAVHGGELSMTAGGSSTGRMSVDRFATLSFTDASTNWPSTAAFQLTGTLVNEGQLNIYGGTVTLDPGLLYRGQGDVNVAGGTLQAKLASPWHVPNLRISGGNAFLETDTEAQTFTMTGGSRGGKGTLTVDSFNFSGGELGNFQSGPGKTIVNGLTTIDGNGAMAVTYGHELVLNGNTVWTEGNGSIGANYAWGSDAVSTIHIAQGTTFLDQGGTGSRYLGMSSEYGVASAFIRNAGHYVREGQGITYANTFQNTGSIDIRSGSLYVQGAGYNEGSIDIASGATLGVRNGAYQMAPFQIRSQASLRNMGSLLVSGSLDIDANALYSGDGEIVLAGGVLQSKLTGTITTRGLTLLGSASFAGNVEANNLVIGNSLPSTVPGRLYGSGTVTTGKLAMTNADLGDGVQAGALLVNGSAVIGGQAWHSIYQGYKLVLQGDTTWQTSDGFALLGIYGATPGSALASGEIRIGDQGIFRDLGMTLAEDSRTLGLNGGRLTNAGTYERSGLGGTDVYADVMNSGRIVAREGTLRLQARLDNIGTIEAHGGRIEIGAPGQFAQFNSTTGTLTGGNYRVVGGAPLVIATNYKADGKTPALIEINQASISLEGPSAKLLAKVGTTEVDALSSLRDNEGELRLLAGAQLVTDGHLRQAGQLVIGEGSTLATQAITQQGGSTFLNGRLDGSALRFDAGILSAGEGKGMIGRGQLHAGTVSLGNALQFEVDLDGQQGWDQLWIDGDVALGGTLLATFQGLPASGIYDILSSSGQISATFGRLDTNLDGASYAVSVLYGTDRVSLSVTAVPEPASWALMVLGLAGLGLHARSRRTSGTDGRM